MFQLTFSPSLLFIFLSFLVASVQFQLVSAATWNRIVHRAPYVWREWHTMTTFPINNEPNLLLIGGRYSDEEITNDIWRSSDNGETWHFMGYGGFAPVVTHATVVWELEDKQEKIAVPWLYKVGGRTSMVEARRSHAIWRSMDAVNWQYIPSKFDDYLEMDRPCVAILKKKMFIIPSTESQLWSSSDGKNFDLELLSGPYGYRYDSTCIGIESIESILLIGSSSTLGRPIENNVWRSDSTGLNWKKIAANTDYVNLQLNVHLYNDVLYMVTGTTNTGGGVPSAIRPESNKLVSTNVSNIDAWKFETLGVAPWRQRSGGRTSLIGTKVVLTGGMNFIYREDCQDYHDGRIQWLGVCIDIWRIDIFGAEEPSSSTPLNILYIIVGIAVVGIAGYFLYNWCHKSGTWARIRNPNRSSNSTHGAGTTAQMPGPGFRLNETPMSTLNSGNGSARVSEYRSPAFNFSSPPTAPSSYAPVPSAPSAALFQPWMNSFEAGPPQQRDAQRAAAYARLESRVKPVTRVKSPRSVTSLDSVSDDAVGQSITVPPTLPSTISNTSLSAIQSQSQFQSDSRAPALSTSDVILNFDNYTDDMSSSYLDSPPQSNRPRRTVNPSGHLFNDEALLTPMLGETNDDE